MNAMAIGKIVKDMIMKHVAPDFAPLAALREYLTNHKGINFRYEKQEDGSLVARSTNFAYGSISTDGKDYAELDRNIKDAILTAFDVPSSYAAEANIRAIGEKGEDYALA